METFKLTYPAFLFIALFIILIASAFWFYASARVGKSLHDSYKESTDLLPVNQISAIKKRIRMTLAMQIMGVSCFLICVVFVYFVFMYLYILAEVMFGMSFGHEFTTSISQK